MTITDPAHETMPSALASPTAPAAPKWFAALGLVSGLGALIASSCCVIPLGLAALGAGAGILGGVETVAAWRVPLLSVSALGVVGGWGAWFRRPVACAEVSACVSPGRSRATLALLLCASAIVLVAASWSYIDPVLLNLLRGR